MTFCYIIINKNTGLFKYTLREICIIFQLLVLGKLKYAKPMLRQVHIFDKKAVDLVFQELYLANAFVNIKDQPSIFIR